MKRAVFRVDGAPFIGIGHIMRCLTLAEKLRGAGWDVRFICRAFENHYADIIENKGFALTLLPAPSSLIAQQTNQEPPHAHWLGVEWAQDAEATAAQIEACDLLVVDHYGIDARWHKVLRDKTSRIMVIDDLADRALDCDILLDQTYGREAGDYDAVSSTSTKMLCGSDYMLLRSVFGEKREAALAKRRTLSKVQNVFVCMGSSDPQNATTLVLQGLEGVQTALTINVILSSKAVHLKDVQGFESRHKVHVYTNHDAVEDLMIEADIAFGAGGTMSWERCCLGLPTILMVVADNQTLIAQKLHDAGAVHNLGRSEDVSAQEIAVRFGALRIEDLKAMSAKAAPICDGQGAQKVLGILDAD